jgi:hypothetical protein
MKHSLYDADAKLAGRPTTHDIDCNIIARCANVWHVVCGAPPHDRFSAAHQYQRVRAVHRFMASFGGLGIHIKGDTIVVSDVLTNSYFVYPINKEASNDPS